MDVKQEVQKQFGKNAGHYVSSPIHAQGEDLAWLQEQCEAEHGMRLLDVATGGGHVAKLFAPIVQQVTAYDLTEEMLEQAKAFVSKSGYGNVRFIRGDAEHMPFADGEYDRVVCRIAAHHFPDVTAFLREAHRVLRPGGCLLLIDNVSPEKDEYDEWYNRIERRRDPSHYRAWKKSEWIRFAEEAGFTVERMTSFPKTFRFHDWCERMQVSDQVRQQLECEFLQAAPDLKRQFHIGQQDGRLTEFQGQAVLIRARKDQAVLC
jgi:ubiquinone/menaquinone biosynthesis C-methylase UbiE